MTSQTAARFEIVEAYCGFRAVAARADTREEADEIARSANVACRDVDGCRYYVRRAALAQVG